MPRRERGAGAGGASIAGDSPPAAEGRRLLMSGRETAEALSISVRLLYSLTQSGELPAVRIGRMVRYRVADVEAFIARHETRSGIG